MLILEDSGYKKLKADHKLIVNKAITKLEHIILGMNDFTEFVANNPAIHDSYDDFYVYKYLTKGFSVRILYRYDDELEIHRFHFKKGDRDNSKYIEDFEDYVSSYYKQPQRR